MPSSSDSGLGGAPAASVRPPLPLPVPLSLEPSCCERPLSNGSGGSTSIGSASGTPARDLWVARMCPAFAPGAQLDAPMQHRHLCRTVALSQADGMNHSVVMPMPSYGAIVSSAAVSAVGTVYCVRSSDALYSILRVIYIL